MWGQRASWTPLFPTWSSAFWSKVDEYVDDDNDDDNDDSNDDDNGEDVDDDDYLLPQHNRWSQPWCKGEDTVHNAIARFISLVESWRADQSCDDHDLYCYQ